MHDTARCTSCGRDTPARDLTTREGRIVCDDCARHIDARRAQSK